MVERHRGHRETGGAESAWANDGGGLAGGPQRASALPTRARVSCECLAGLLDAAQCGAPMDSSRAECPGHGKNETHITLTTHVKGALMSESGGRS